MNDDELKLLARCSAVDADSHGTGLIHRAHVLTAIRVRDGVDCCTYHWSGVRQSHLEVDQTKYVGAVVVVGESGDVDRGDFVLCR